MNFSKHIPGIRRLAVCILLAGLQLSSNALAQDDQKAATLWTRAAQEDTHMASRPAAIVHIDQALALKPKNPQYWQTKAAILVNMEEHEEALPCINKSLELDPKSASSWQIKAVVLSGLGRNKEALDAANQAVQLDGYLNYRLTKAQILADLHNFDQAEKELDDMIKLYPKDQITRARRAFVARHTQHWNKVIEDSTFLINQLGPRSQPYYEHIQNRAAAYVNTKQYDQAIADYKLGLKASPDDRRLHSALLNVYKIIGNTKGAQVESTALENLDHDLTPLK